MERKVNYDSCSLNDGQATLEMPTNLSSQSVQDVVDWLELMLRKYKRRVAEDAKDLADCRAEMVTGVTISHEQLMKELAEDA